MIRFTPLASSSVGCCYFVEDKEGNLPPFLIDPGLPYHAIQKRSGHKALDCAFALVSHSHMDHARGVRELAARGLKILGSKDTLDGLGLVGAHARLLPLELRTQAGWMIKSFPAVHDSPGTLGFVIDGAGDRMLYLTDSAYSPYTFDGLTVIAIECNHSAEIIKDNALDKSIEVGRFKRTISTHMSLERLLEMLKANDLSKLREIHLLHLSDANSNEAKFKIAVQKATGVPVYVAPTHGQVKAS